MCRFRGHRCPRIGDLKRMSWIDGEGNVVEGELEFEVTQYTLLIEAC